MREAETAYAHGELDAETLSGDTAKRSRSASSPAREASEAEDDEETKNKELDAHGTPASVGVTHSGLSCARGLSRSIVG